MAEKCESERSFMSEFKHNNIANATLLHIWGCYSEWKPLSGRHFVERQQRSKFSYEPTLPERGVGFVFYRVAGLSIMSGGFASITGGAFGAFWVALLEHKTQ